MPYLGRLNGEEVIPPQAPDDASVLCPACGEELSVVSSHRRQGAFISRYFRHKDNSECSGESDTHLKWKSIAYSKLRSRYPSAELRLEGSVGDRRTDVLVEFESQSDSDGLGNGLCVEVQYKHEGKDVNAVTQDFISEGYSVLWLSEEQFQGKDVELEGGEWIEWWVHQVPPATDWSGYHDIVHWLRQTNYASVELTVPILFESEKAIENWGIRSAWLHGVQKRDGEEVPIRYPCVSCGELVTGFVPVTYKLNPKEHLHTSSFWMDLVFNGHDCPHCGRFNKIHRHAVRTVSMFNPGDARCDKKKDFEPTSKLQLPCMQCGSGLFLKARTDPVSNSNGSKVELTVEDSVECSECGSLIKSYHNSIWVSTSR